MDPEYFFALLGGGSALVGLTAWLVSWRINTRNRDETGLTWQQTAAADHVALLSVQADMMLKVEELLGKHAKIEELQEQTLILVGEVSETCQMMAATTIWLIQLQNPEAPIPPQLQRILDKTS